MFQAIPHTHRVGPNAFIPVADGDINTKSYAYIMWLIIVSPDTHPVLQQLRRLLRSSVDCLVFLLYSKIVSFTLQSVRRKNGDAKRNCQLFPPSKAYKGTQSQWGHYDTIIIGIQWRLCKIVNWTMNEWTFCIKKNMAMEDSALSS